MKKSQPSFTPQSAALICAAPEPVLKAGLHTPGPWMVWQSNRDNSVNVAAEKDRAFVCEVGKIADDDYNDETIRADARLIAAAPDLLEAVGRLLEFHITAHNHPIHAAAREALKKARGE